VSLIPPHHTDKTKAQDETDKIKTKRVFGFGLESEFRLGFGLEFSMPFLLTQPSLNSPSQVSDGPDKDGLGLRLGLGSGLGLGLRLRCGLELGSEISKMEAGVRVKVNAGVRVSK
jgi:hypothetical protein